MVPKALTIMNKLKTLKGRLWFLGGTLFLLAGLMSIMYYSYVETEEIKRDSMSHLQTATLQHLDYVTFWYETRISDLRGLAKLNWEDHPEEVNRFLKEYIKEEPQFEFISFFNENGEAFLSTFEESQFNGKHVRDRECGNKGGGFCFRCHLK